MSTERPQPKPRAFILLDAVDGEDRFEPPIVVTAKSPTEAARLTGGRLGSRFKKGWKIFFDKKLFKEPPEKERERYDGFLIWRKGPLEVVMDPKSSRRSYMIMIEAPLMTA